MAAATQAPAEARQPAGAPAARGGWTASGEESHSIAALVWQLALELAQLAATAAPARATTRASTLLALEDQPAAVPVVAATMGGSPLKENCDRRLMLQVMRPSRCLCLALLPTSPQKLTNALHRH